MKPLISSRFQKNTISVLILAAIISLMLPAVYTGIQATNIASGDIYGKTMILGLSLSLVFVFFHEEINQIIKAKNTNNILIAALIIIGIIFGRNVLNLIATHKNLSETTQDIQYVIINGTEYNSVQETGIAIGFYLVIFFLFLSIVCFFIAPLFPKTQKIHK